MMAVTATARPRPHRNGTSPEPAGVREERAVVDALQSLPASSLFKQRLEMAYRIVQANDGRLPELVDAIATESDERRLANLLAEFQRISGQAPDVASETYLGARPLSAVSTAPPQPLRLGYTDPTGHTILFGPGDAGKGTLTASWIMQLAAAGERVLIVDYENHPEEWARRIDGLGGHELLDKVLHVAPASSAWHGRRGALWVQADELRRLAEADASTYVVIDSIVVACGGADPLKPEAPAQYAAALEYIGRPALSIAHANRAEDLRYPFGSSFWHNLARVTWSLKRQGESAVLAMRKANNYQRLPRQLVTVTWWEGRPTELTVTPVSVVLADRIAEVLAEQPFTLEAIVEALNAGRDEEEEPVKKNSVLQALRRGAKGTLHRFDIVDEKWGLAE